MRLLLTTLSLLISAMLTAQAPALIPYQAIARDGAGQPLSDATLNARFTIHNESASGTIAWQELQSVNTNSLGLFTSQLGGTSSLATVNWAVGSKYLQVELDLGNGFIEIGTQQMLSVPYALHAGNVRVHASAVGDTLFVGDGSFVIIPGISEANQTTGGGTTGTTLHTCGAENIHNAELTYGSMTDQEGNDYKTIVIGTQEWMAENLNTSIYRNGDAIATSLNDAGWQSTMIGAWTHYNSEASYTCPHGKLYNWYACVDTRQLCPSGWHVPTDGEWNTLMDFLGGMDVAGGKMKTTGTLQLANGLWYAPNTGATNSAGFSGAPQGYRYFLGEYDLLGSNVFWWSTDAFLTNNAISWFLSHTESGSFRSDFDKNYGFSVRCLRD
jgi:uncharacterized protein (TIGR02145 family)